MSASEDRLIQIAPQYTGDDRISWVLAEAARFHAADNSTWGFAYQDAMCYFALHFLVILDQILAQNTAAGGGTGGGASMLGPVKSRGARDLSESYATPDLAALTNALGGQVQDAQLAQTPYGQRYLFIRNTRAATKPLIIRV